MRQKMSCFDLFSIGYPVASGLGGTQEHPPEIGKIVVEICCSLAEGYTFGEKAEVHEIFSKQSERAI